MKSLTLLDTHHLIQFNHILATTFTTTLSPIIITSSDHIQFNLYSITTTQPPTPFCTFFIQSNSTAITSSHGNPIVSFKYLAESDSLCIILANGDIEQILDLQDTSDDKMTINVGTIEQGIKSAAWSPDDELLVIITADDKLIEMTKDFEVLSEGSLKSNVFGEDAPVNVGWGEKSTQFHGSVGKSAATANPDSAAITTNLSSSPDDDGKPIISWRGDGAFFCVSSLDPLPNATGSRRILRVFSRVASLSSTSEPTPGVEHVLAWQPSGSIIATSQKLIDSNKPDQAPSQHIIFFERNGLRRYDFALREDLSIDVATGIRKKSRIKSLEWNSDSTLLAVWIQRLSGTVATDVVQLWHRNNYYWYLKQEVSPRLSHSNLTNVFWHLENPLDLYLTTSTGIESFSFCWDTFSSSRPLPDDSGSVAVVDGASTKLTPFRNANIPPPMSSTIALSSQSSRTPVHISFSATSNQFVSLYTDGFIEVWDWNLPASSATGRSRSEVSEATIKRTHRIVSTEATLSNQCAYVGEGSEGVVAVLQSTGHGNEARLVLITAEEEMTVIEIPEGARRLVAGSNGFVLETPEGVILEIATNDIEARVSDRFSAFPEFCAWIQFIPLPSSSATIVGLSESGRLYSGSHSIATDATSFTFTPDFLIYTTFSHEAKFITLASLERIAANPVEVYYTETMKKMNGGAAEKGQDSSVIKRSIERGSRIVTVVPSATTLVLQMPRGNIETIYPRPLVLQIVRHDLDTGRYRAAFLGCRRHRIDLNILYDHNPVAFKSHLSDFITQVKEVDYLNLFLSGLKDDDVTTTMYKPLVPSTLTRSSILETTSKVNLICDLVRADLETRDVFHYATTILTTHARKQPPDYESALKVLAKLKAQDATRAEDAVKYIIFLSDANKLFDLALGMYDFALVLMIAQHSQKDPREYLPFLRDLRQLDQHLQRFKIDDHLQRYDSALKNLAQAGPEHFDETVEYTKRHGLFTIALTAFKNDPVKYKIILAENAEYLMTKQVYAEAGILFSLAGQTTKALHSYQKANAWQELFTLALSEGKRTGAEIKALAIEVADRLREKRRYFDAGRVLLEYGRDVDAAVAAFVEAGAFAEALRLTALYSKRDLIETHIKPGVLEVHSRLTDDFAEVLEQVEKQVERLVELRIKRDENPDQYYCLYDPLSAIDNVEMQPDGVSDAGTAFTRYTVAPTTIATTRITSRTARSKRKNNMKKLTGRKGTLYEETYLLNSIKKVVEVKILEFQVETGALLPVLLALASSALRSSAATLQADLTALETSLASILSTIWDPRESEWKVEKREETASRERGEWIEPGPVEEGMERVLRPTLAKGKWRIGVLDVV